MPILRYQKNVSDLKNILIKREWFEAIEILDLCQNIHVGTRKDGITPSFSHQVEMSLFLCKVPKIKFPEDTIITALAHDTPEDYGIEIEKITKCILNKEKRIRIQKSIEALTKEYRGERKKTEDVMNDISNDIIASIVKPIDRIHNQGSMKGVFSEQKKCEYINETKSEIIPTLKIAKNNFPYQDIIYRIYNIILKNQIMIFEKNLNIKPF